MKPTYWHTQKSGQPLFPELEWSRPENRQHAGKLLIAGGNLHAFAAPAEVFAVAGKAGIGSARVLLPDATRAHFRAMQSSLDMDFAPSTPSGSFSQKALAEFLSLAAWADGVLVAGDLGRNSETAILLESFLGKFAGPLTLTKDAVDYAVSAPRSVLHRPQTLLVLSLSQLQRLAVAADSPTPVTFGMDLLHLVEWLHEFTQAHRPYLIVKHLDQLLVAVAGQVSSTALPKNLPIWRVATAARASVWWLQHPQKPFEAITVAVGNT